jgi:glycosyltransferase involved in cell wall biosynthesis
MEAMALGVPVVASAVSGIPELVRDGSSGILVPPGEPLAIADAVERLAADVHLRRMIVTKARRTVEARFDLAQSGRAMTALFEHDPQSATPNRRSITPVMAGSPARSNA